MTEATRTLMILMVLFIGGYAVLLLPNIQKKVNDTLMKECLANVFKFTKSKAQALLCQFDEVVLKSDGLTHLLMEINEGDIFRQRCKRRGII